MTRFARKGGVIEKRETKKKKEEATEWSSMIESPADDKLDKKDNENHPKDNKNQEDVNTNKNKRKHDEDTVEEKSSEQDREVASSSGGEKRKKSGLPINREILLRIHGEHIDKEVLADLDDMLERKKLTLEEYADAIVREGRSNRRRLDRKNERDSSRICFNCREPGHCVEQCPAVLKSNDVGTGICYKCGSTEHSVNRCKVRVEPGKYPYATCFICKEQGHLSKQCPDNPRGLYPNGSSDFLLFDLNRIIIIFNFLI